MRSPPMSTATGDTLTSAAKAMLSSISGTFPAEFRTSYPQLNLSHSYSYSQQYRLALSYLEWVLNVKSEDLCNFEAMVRKEYGSASPAPPRQPVKLRKQPAADCANTNPYPPQSPLLPHSPPLHFNSTSHTPSTCQTPPLADLVKVPAKDVVPVEQSLHTPHPECEPGGQLLRKRADITFKLGSRPKGTPGKGQFNMRTVFELGATDYLSVL
ncbi:hypothetical protein FRC06_008245, partial [Ceratobasidium sp. 370]